MRNAQGRNSSSTGHLPSLDGLRAISILLVFIGHVNGTRNFGFHPNIYLPGDLAHLGVTVFFVISGFLITTLLIGEYENTGRVSLKLFYARRSLRIFPASYAYMAIIALLGAAGAIALTRRDLLFSLTYTVNYMVDPSWYIGHLWSLSVEEQFYLLWAFTFAALGPKRSVRVAAACILLVPLFRILNRMYLLHTPYYGLPMFQLVADSLATGCLLAASRGWLESKSWYLKLFRPAVSLLLVLVILFINRYLTYTLVNVFGTALINILIAVLIHRSVVHYEDAFGRMLNWRPVAFIGVLSYSLYLWQQPFLDRKSSSWLTAFPQNLLFAFLAALASYTLLEKPLMRLRKRLHAGPEHEPAIATLSKTAV